MSTCPDCQGEGSIITCCDDMCHGAGRCIHGDGEVMCVYCNGTGEIGDDDDYGDFYEEQDDEHWLED